MKMYAFIISIFVPSILVPQSGLADASTAGKFKATMGDKIYDLDVTCDRFSKNKVMFRSDDESGYYSKPKDTNGDNITVYGLPGVGEGLTLALTINDKGEYFTVNTSIKGDKFDLEMSGNTLTGKGKILGSGYINPIIEFTLTCQ